jgi:small-conductance mechanosensitive channel
MMAEYSWAIDDALRRHGIEVPYPQTDIRVRSFFGEEGERGRNAWSAVADGEG